MELKALLNEKQYEAVTTAAPFVRIIAGAGSGKTRVLTFRIAFLIDEMKADPYHIVAITFTNKVAKEMRERLAKLLGDTAIYRGLSIMTFHSLCARFLRQEIYNIGYRSNFTIIDDEDQEKIVKELASEMYSCSKNDPLIKLALSYIRNNKMKGILPGDLSEKINLFPDEDKCIEMFTRYEQYLYDTGNLDFDDLLLKTIQILKAFPNVQKRWHQRIDHILIDEFQDTNDVQYQLVRLLKKETATLYVVGDPDQTIYTWRGANQSIILDIDKHYNMETIILNENYRSTQTILDTANRLIMHNRKRVKKDLFTHNGIGSPISVCSFYRSEEEANWVVDQIKNIEQECQKDNRPFSYRDVAILYRSSYLTLPFEKAFNRWQIPYHIFGSLRFYQRKEIKDVLAYFQLLINSDNEVALLRIINVPKRGVGEKALYNLKEAAHNQSLSLYEFLKQGDFSMVNIRSSVLQSLQAMINKLEEAKNKLSSNLEAYSAVLESLINSLGYKDYLLLEDDNGQERWENVKSLFDDLSSYINNNPESGFQDYMENVSLQSAQDEMEDGDYISLMTIHTAKGLEYPYIFVIGLSEGIFPSARTLEENPVLGLEEERRLCYVAFTRAMERLYVSCNREYSYVLNGLKPPSRFLKEAGLIYSREPKTDESHKWETSSSKKSPMVQKAAAMDSNNINDWKKGDLVTHEKFGDGIVINVINDSIIEISFSKVGRKTLMAQHPFLKRIKKGGFDA